VSEPVRPVVDGGDPLDVGPGRPRRGPIDPALLRLAPSLRRHLVICAVLAGVATLAILAQAEAIGRQLPHLIDGDLSAVTPLAVALAVIALIRLGLRWGTEVSASIAAAGARRAITDRVVGHALVVDEVGAAHATPARVTTLVTDGVDALDPWIRNYVPALCLAGVVPLAAGARILLADVASAVILLVAIPLIPVFMVLIGKLAEDRANRQWATLQRLAGHFHDVLVGLPTLRLFGRAEVQVERVRAVAEQYRSAVMRTLKVAFLSAATMELLAMLSVALVAVTIGYRLTIGEVTLETALIVLLLAPECSLPIRRVGAAFHAAQAGTDAAEELTELLTTSTTPDGPVDRLPDRAEDLPVLQIAGATVVDPERGRRVGPLDATIAPGTLVALVGASGAGKSTLLDAVRGRVPLHRGTVELDGVDVTQLSRRARSRAMAWIPQLPEPVGADVRAAVGADVLTAVSGGDVDEVLRSLDLLHLAERAPAELSGGELQRVAVARAVVSARRPGDDRVRVLLADEPTSHLDAGRAALVLDALQSVADAGPAVVVATHDSRLIESADQVVLLDDLPSSAAGFAASDSSPYRAGPSGAGALAAGGGAGRDDVRAGGGRRAGTTSVPTGTADAVRTGARTAGSDLAWFRRMARPVRSRLLLSRALGVATELCTIGLAATAAWLIVRASQRPSFADLAVAAVAVRAFGLGKGILRYGERMVSHDAVFRLLADVRGEVVGRLGQVAPAGVPGMERGDVMARVVDDVDRMADQELRVMAPMISGLTVGVGVVAGAALAAPGFGTVYAAAVVLVGIALPALTRALAASTATRQAAARAELAGSTLELVEHGDELTTTGAATTWTGRIQAAVDRLGVEERRRGRRAGLVEGVAAATAPLLAAAVVVVDRASGATVDGPVLGVLVLVPFALLEVLTPLLAAGEQQASVHTAARRLRAVLEAPDPVVEPAAPVDVPEDPAVVLDGVSLRWPLSEVEVVRDLDLRLPAGARARIDGPSGSGKSTVAAALVRFIPVERGTYLLGGVDSELEGGANVRRAVTWCQQSPWLAATSLRENLHVAAPSASDDELWAALDAVRLSDWAIGLPDGLSTLVGRDGSAISGGQRQRLALARVLLADHRVVVLDEPTAHLDAATAAAVFTDLLDALGDRSVLVLGHGGAPDEQPHPAAVSVAQITTLSS
jgi:ATP-binding cassette subfamily C protein CydCD